MIITYRTSLNYRIGKYFSDEESIHSAMYDFLKLARSRRRRVHPEGKIGLRVNNQAVNYHPTYAEFEKDAATHIGQFIEIERKDRRYF
jgi:hypothetical protein